MTIEFKTPPTDKSVLEGSGPFTPKFNADGLVTAIVTDVQDGEVVMLAHMNSEALALTIETGIAHYYSRSRKSLWKKGETSGNIQLVQEMRADCDQDAILIKVEMAGEGTACHTNRKSCFYRKVEGLNTTSPSLRIIE
ncbi:phosphoribosyl-AMP cyclohydrolase [Lentilitoribacter sp. EG35]|uniref:phosphoribosyl-AMP cyclohydrolase n=1 Tax=Lentilitoribacter sp. EG35 TaxID=3234192 RepID=UPI00345F8EE5